MQLGQYTCALAAQHLSKRIRLDSVPRHAQFFTRAMCAVQKPKAYIDRPGGRPAS